MRDYQFSYEPDAAPRASLADYLDLLLPNGADALIDGDARRRIATLAGSMIPVPRIAVECRLAAGREQVDIQQCLRRDEGEYPALAEWARSLLAARPGDSSFASLSAFSAELARDESLLHRGIDELYLEHDLPVGGAAPGPFAVPAVFISVPEDDAAARHVVAVALAMLRPTPPSPMLVASIDRCFSACASLSLDAGVSHVGVMLSRDGGVVRANIKGLRPLEVAPVLAHCEWPGDTERAARLFDDAADRVDRVTLALDIGEVLLPRVGVECFLDEQPGRDPSWRVNLDELCAGGLCAPSKARAFLSVPGDVFPPAVARPWPAAMLLESLLRPETEFTTFARRAVHFKITETLGAGREAKAYFGAGHRWVGAAADPFVDRWRPTLATPRRKRSVRPPPPSSNGEIADAIERAVSFLLQQQLQSGLWRDFNVPTGISDEWVSGFVGTQMLATGDCRAQRAVEDCHARLLRRQRANGGWSFNRDHPPDADSTSWVLRLCASLGREADDAFRGGTEFLARHHLESGGVASYVEEFVMSGDARLPSRTALDAMLLVHDCVTGAAAPFAPDRIAAYLRGRQRDGRWIGYFWVHDAYPTWLAVDALRSWPASGDSARLAAAEVCAAQWLERTDRGSARDDSTAFDAACALRILLGSANSQWAAQIDRAAAWLAAGQEDDGSWRQGARMRVPLSGAAEPAGGAEFVTLDQRRTFTTAAAAGALAAVLARQDARPDVRR